MKPIRLIAPLVFVFVFVFALASCSTDPKDATEPEHPKSILPPSSGSSAADGVMAGLFLGLTVVMRPPTATEKHRPVLFGACHMTAGDVGATCGKTYLLLRDEKDGSASRAWLDEDGRFEVAWRGPASVTAVSEEYGLRSMPLRVDRPGRLEIALNPDLKGEKKEPEKSDASQPIDLPLSRPKK